jgi:hypothetical protein
MKMSSTLRMKAATCKGNPQPALHVLRACLDDMIMLKYVLAPVRKKRMSKSHLSYSHSTTSYMHRFIVMLGTCVIYSGTTGRELDDHQGTECINELGLMSQVNLSRIQALHSISCWHRFNVFIG